MLRKRTIENRLKTLDAVKDHKEIVYLLTCYQFPWDFLRAMEFAQFRTHAVPTISGLLAKTGELIKRPKKRYEDTGIIIWTIVEKGYDSPEAERAIKRMNNMHHRYPIANEDSLYVLSTFIYEPIRWTNRYGFRKLRQNEKEALYYFYRELGTRMGVKDIPSTYEEYEAWNIDFEKRKFRYAPSNEKVGHHTIDFVLDMYLPKPLWFLGRPIINALLDAPMLSAFDLKKAPDIVIVLVNMVLLVRKKIISVLPERRKPFLGSKQKFATYPEGYNLEEVGTFKLGAE